MKVIVLLLSIIVFGVAGYYFAMGFKSSNELNYLIYMGMLLILMSICVVAIMINIPYIISKKRNISKKSVVRKQAHILRLKKHNYALRKEPKFQDMI